MPKQMYYVLKKHSRMSSNNPSNKGEYTYIHARINAPNEKVALSEAKRIYGDDVTVTPANRGYKEGR